MNSQVGEIGYFQLSNLVQNKVPFSLLLIDFNATDKKEMESESVLRNGVFLTSQMFFSHLSDMKVSLEYPFVLVCTDGVTSLSFASQLVEKGYKNVYSIKGGWKSLDQASKSF